MQIKQLTSLRLFIIIRLPVCILICCGSTSGKSMKPNDDIYLYAWSEDTINDFQFALIKRDKFSYSIVTHDEGVEKKELYKGTISYRSDTVCLNFKNKQPNDLVPYLVVEASGSYLIQYFKDGKKRIFLRIQRPKRFRCW